MQEFNEFLRLIRISSFFIFFCPRLINAARMTTASVPLPCDAAGEHYAAITSERPFRWPLVLERSLIAEFNVRGQCAIFIGASSRDRGSAARTRYREKSRTRASAPMMTIPSIIPMMTRVSRGNRSSSSRGGGGGRGRTHRRRGFFRWGDCEEIGSVFRANRYAAAFASAAFGIAANCH
jgi:hypothetical protein